MSAPPINAWDRLPGESATDYEYFLTWCSSDPPIDPGDWWRGVLSRRPPTSRPEDFQAFADVVNRWAWLQRREPFLTRLLTAKALGLVRRLESAEAGARALEWSSRSMGVAVEKLATWEKAPATVPDGVALAIVREHRTRQRDSGEIRPTSVVEVKPPPAYDLSQATPEELAALEELERRLERFRVKP